MIVLDTNVLSEMLRLKPEPTVIKWLSRQRPAAVFTTSVTEAEIRYGVARLPAGSRRDILDFAIQGIFDEYVSGRILSFDSEAAVASSKIVTLREKAARPIRQFDAQIAAIAYSRGADLASRNTRDFESCGLNVLNPWD